MLISRNKLTHSHDPYLSKKQDSIVNIDNSNFYLTIHFCLKSQGESKGKWGLVKVSIKVGVTRVLLLVVTFLYVKRASDMGTIDNKCTKNI